MKGDILASGGKRATFTMGGDDRDAPIALKNVAPENETVPDLVDNSAMFTKPKVKLPYYKAKSPLSDRVLVKRLEERKEGSIIIPDSAKGKSDVGVVIACSPFMKQQFEPGALVLFDKYASVGQEIMLGDEHGEVHEHLIVQECDLIMELEIVIPKAEDEE